MHDNCKEHRREHGGNLDVAIARYGVPDMVDLSTGISPHPYPAAAIMASAWQALPTSESLATCLAAARNFYGVVAPMDICAGAGTQALLQMVPRLIDPGPVWIGQPTYNEHAPAWSDAGHTILVGKNLPDDARHAVMVVPNNPTGDAPFERLSDLASELARRDGFLIIDGAFATTEESRAMLQATSPSRNIVHLRSFGKFFGMAGLRLGFAVASPDMITALSRSVGPWAVNSAALAIGTRAMQDHDWIQAHEARLSAAADRLATLLRAHALVILGGTFLFQTVQHQHAHDLHDHLARRGIWTRIYADWPNLLRFGLPADESVWQKLEQALNSWSQTYANRTK